MTNPGLYQHYKGDIYRVLFTGLESTNGRPRKPVVIYIGSKNIINVRDEEEFHQLVDGKPRFKLITPAHELDNVK